MELKEVIKNRRSIRKYLSKHVDVELILHILETAIWAPTACNRQDCFFIIVDDKKLISKIVDAGGSKLLLKSDKVLFVLYSTLTDNLEYSDHIQSASAIIQNYLLLACELGIGTCWVCHLPRKRKLRKLLNISNNIDVIAAISMGYANFDNIRSVKRKYTIKDVTGINTFYSKKVSLGGKKEIYLKIILNKLYYFLPTVLKKYINEFLDKYFVKKFDN